MQTSYYFSRTTLASMHNNNILLASYLVCTVCTLSNSSMHSKIEDGICILCILLVASTLLCIHTTLRYMHSVLCILCIVHT